MMKSSVNIIGDNEFEFSLHISREGGDVRGKWVVLDDCIISGEFKGLTVNAKGECLNEPRYSWSREDRPSLSWVAHAEVMVSRILDSAR